jgi:hypothetical protein
MEIRLLVLISRRADSEEQMEQILQVSTLAQLIKSAYEALRAGMGRVLVNKVSSHTASHFLFFILSNVSVVLALTLCSG